MLFSVLGITIAHDTLNPTYEYYGEMLSADEFVMLTEGDIPLHCIQLPHEIPVLSGKSFMNYVCFNTAEEVDIYYAEVLNVEYGTS